MGVIVAAGPGKKDEEMKLAVGDKVVYFKFAGDKMTVRAALARRSSIPRCAHIGCSVRMRVSVRLSCGSAAQVAASLTCRARFQDDKGTEFVVLHQNDILGKL